VASLFVERMALHIPEHSESPPSLIYSEEFSYNVAPDGQPLVASGMSGGTITFTKVQDEQDDADPDQTLTKTFVAAESDDQDT